jgi:hypothetical protein
LVPDHFDTVLTLVGTNLAGVAGTIKVIADDGAGGRTTNSFTATTVADGNFDQAFIFPPNTVTNLVAPMNVPLTNSVAATNLQGSAIYWFDYWQDYNSTNSTISPINGQLVVKPNTNFIGNTGHYIVVSTNSQWNLYYYYGLSLPPYDLQLYTFTFGDTPVSALATNFIAPALVPFSNQLIATFTNGVPNSSTNNFSAFINWGDNSTNSGVITTNSLGRKEVRGSHRYTNSGDYPVDITLQSTLGASATLVCTSTVPPSLSLTRLGTNNSIGWPAWAFAYQLLSNTNLTSMNWVTITNLSSLVAYQNVVTNSTANSGLFFRLKK